MGILGAIIGVLFVFGALVAMFRPQYALLFIILLFPAKQLLQASIPFLQTQGILVNIAAAMVVLTTATTAMMSGRRITQGFVQGVTIAVILLYCQVLIGVAYSPARDAAIYFLGLFWPYALLIMVGMPLMCARLDDFRAIIPAFLITGSIVALFILFNPAGKMISGRYVLEIGRTAAGSLSGNPLATAELGGMLMICAALYRGAGGTGLLVMRMAALIIGLYLALISGSRGQLLFALLVLVMGVPIAYRLKSIGSFVGAVIGLGFVLATLYFAVGLLDPMAMSRWSGRMLDEGLEARFNPASQMLTVFATSPLNYLTGLGTSAFNAYNNSLGSNTFQYAHNILIETVAEQGLLGLTLLGVACGMTAVWVRRLHKLYADDGPARGAIAVLAAMTLYSLLLAAKQGSLLGLPTFFGWMILTAKIAKVELLLAQQHSESITHEHVEAHADDSAESEAAAA